ncbi:MAG: hypothetical protein NVS1B7_2430 [Candidatus Saccharimonadales bacterium]
MGKWLPTPVDSVGMPLPIAPLSEVLPVGQPEQANWHHHFHPSTDERLATIGGAALRNSRLQLVDAWQHNRGRNNYHTYFGGPEIPTSESEQFKLCVLACAGYLPAQGIDLSRGEPRIINLTLWQQRHFMMAAQPAPLRLEEVVKRQSRRGLLDLPVNLAEQLFLQEAEKQAGLTYRHLTYRYDPVRLFFEHYTAKQPLDHVQPTKIDEFLSTKQAERKHYLGHWLLAKAVEEATTDVEKVYAEVRAEHLLHPLMPNSPQTLVKHKLGTASRRLERAIPLLEAKLRVA